MEDTKINILLLDGQTIQAVAVAEYLKRPDYRIISFCDSKESYGYHTTYVDEKILCPKSKDHNAFFPFLKNYLSNNKVDVLIPMNDDSALFMSEFKKELLAFTNFIIPDKETFYAGYDKNLLMNLCKTNNLPHPKSSDLSIETTESACEYVGFPAILKPNFTSGGRGMKLIDNKEELERVLPQTISEYGDCHLQEFISPGGKQFKVQIYRDQEKSKIYSTVIEKIRYYPETGGSSCFNKTISNDDLVELCVGILNILDWDGFADFDLIEDPEDNIIKIMEINPRLPACIKSSFVSGINFAQIIVSKSLGLEIPGMSYSPEKYLRYLAFDVLWFLHSPKRFSTKPNWFSFFLKNTYYQDLSWKDPMPFLIGLFGGVLKFLNPSFRKAKSGMRKS
jgi:predicted ATP-grasp superfamily ATP-dependent carboligase